MTRTELMEYHAKICARARDVMAKKNHDYATNDDIFRNFRTFGRFGVLVRMSDKLARLQSYLENGKFEVMDEQLTDTVLDIINYAIIFAAYEENRYNVPGNSISEPKGKHGSKTLSEGMFDSERDKRKSLGSEVEGGCPGRRDRSPLATVESSRQPDGFSY